MRHLAIMVKRPVAGAVKTRLARVVGAPEAVRFYRACVARLLRELGRDRRWRTMLVVTPDAAIRAPIWPAGLPRVPQGPGDLGARMQRLFDLPVTGAVVIIGSDIPGIRAGHIAAAFRLLGQHDVVFGPAPDGGYWLVGARRRPCVPQPFVGVRWSTQQALSDTVARARGSIGYLPVLCDVDDAEDWRRWRRSGAFRP